MRFDLKSAMLIVLQALLVLVPLTWVTSTSELFEFPKMLLTYAGAIIMAGLWGMRMIQEKRLIFRRTPFGLPILLFVASQTIASLLSIHPYTSLFGYYSRFNGGLLSILSYALIYFATVSNFTKDDAIKIVKTLIITAVLSALYAFPEHFGHSPSCLMISGNFNASCWVQDVQNRVFGTFGQPNWLAAYLLVIVPLTTFLFASAKTISRRLLYGVATALILATIAFTKSQSGLGATAIALGLSVSIIALQKKKPLLIAGLISLGAIIILTKPHAVSKTLNSLNNINPFFSTTSEIVARDNATRVGGTDSMVIRRVVWEGAWNLFKQHPIFGTGVETFAYSYYNVRPVEHNLISEWDFLYNKAHNEFLNYAATTGIVGLGTYLLFLGSFIIWAIRRTAGPPNRPLIPALLTGVIALSVSNFFGFSTVPVNTLLFLFPALAILISENPEAGSRKQENNKKVNIYSKNSLASFLLLASCFLLLNRVLAMYTADKLYAAGKSARESKNYQTAIVKLQEATRLMPAQALYTDELSLAASEVAVNLFETGKVEEASQAAAIAVALSNKTMDQNPVHLNFYKTRAKLFLNLAAINPAYGVEAGVTLDKAIRLAPTDAKLWFNRALLTYQLGFKEESLGIFQKTLELKPDYNLARSQYEQILDTSPPASSAGGSSLVPRP